MGNAIQFGIYRFVLIGIFGLSFFTVAAQDFVLSLKEDTQKIKISSWYLNQFLYQEDTKTFFTDEVNAVYRAESEVVYQPYSSFVEDLDYVDFLLPTIESIRALGTDYFRDENLEVWVTGDYVLYEIRSSRYAKEKYLSNVVLDENQQDKLSDSKLFASNEKDSLIEIPNNVIFIYHDSVGFNKIVADDIEEDYFKLLLSRYTFDAKLNDTIFSEDFKLKDKNFLDFFDEEISALTAVQYSDKDLAEYYITSLRDHGALILLLNLDMRKIELYRNSGNTKLADNLERDLWEQNISYYLGFTDTALFNFCNVYVTDAKNRTAILAGETQNIFLNKDLKVDSTITLKEDFYLFARKGQVFETQLIDPDNHKKKEVTSTPVVQNAMVIYGRDNVQVMSPFPFYVRISTAQLGNKKKIKKKETEIDEKSSSFEEFDNLTKYVETKYNVENLKSSELAVAISFDQNLTRFYNNIINGRAQNFKRFDWGNEKVWTNGAWEMAPVHFYSPQLPNKQIHDVNQWFNSLPR